MSKVIVFRNYNNHFNRIVKGHSITSLQAFITNFLAEGHSNTDYYIFNSVNFDYGDGLTTSQPLNYGQSGATPAAFAQYLNFIPDYMIVAEDDDIKSRWFVEESPKHRGYQYLFNLRRDVVADWYAAIIAAPAFVEKAMLPSTNKLIFNTEGMELNQIKQSERLLKDYTGQPWIVGYIARNLNTDTAITTPAKIQADYSSSSFSYSFNTNYRNLDNIKATVSISPQIGFGEPKSLKFKYGISSDWLSTYDVEDYIESFYGFGIIQVDHDNFTTWNNFRSYAIDTYKDNYEGEIRNSLANLKAAVVNLYTNILDQSTLTDFLNLDGKIYFDEGTNKYYKLEVQRVATSDVEIASQTIRGILTSAASNILVNNDTVNQSGYYNLSATSTRYVLTKTEYTVGSLSTQISATRNHLEDAPYDMFCMPYNHLPLQGLLAEISGGTVVGNQSEIILNIAQAIGAAGGTGQAEWCYDIQILPYCPIQSLIIGTTLGRQYIDLTTLTEHVDYEVIQQTGSGGTTQDVGIILYATKSKGSFNIPLNIPVLDAKVENECDMYRLVSPNYQGAFEFNLAKNGGLQFFNVDYYYKPYNPFIHVNPNFGGLYGRDFKDQRGLICLGDYSITIVNDQFKTFEIANKNYQATFDRQIQNLEVQRKYQRIEQIAGILSGSIGSSVQGALAGGAGGAAGMVAGASIGALGSAGAGIADYVISESLFKENKDYLTDQFNYNLGNIKALPYSLSKSSQLTNIYKFFPFLEKYSCSDEEREAFKNKIRYNGMTVMVIGKIKDYLSYSPYDYTFIQAQLIRLETISEDANIARAIYNEIKKGVYI